MAVYRHGYKGYNAALTAPARRWTIVARYAWKRIFQSRLLGLFLALCMFYPMLCIAYIYLLHNPALLLLLQMRPDQMMLVDGRFFFFFCCVQGALALLLTAIVGPGLISPDIVNGALPLYFCRPFSRLEYLAGKLSVLMLLLSLITWIPGLLVYMLRGAIIDWQWAWDHLYLAVGMFTGLFAWILLLSLIALAFSAWVKWRLTASALILALFFAGAGFGAAFNDVMRTDKGTLFDLSGSVRVIWADLLRFDTGATLPASSAWLVLAATALVCCALLARRIRAFEVVK